MEFREAVLMQRLGLTGRLAARQEIERDDTAHNGTMQRMFGIDWTDPAHYTIVLNAARVPVQECVDCIVRMVQAPAFAQTESSRAELMNQLISARIRSALERHFGSDVGALVKTEVNAGRTVLTGQMVDAQYIAEAVRLVRSVEGVTGVESRIIPLGFQPMELS
jgi:osmotically-inducible protein OsmY